MGLLRRSVELGMGALLLTKETAEQLVRELVEDDNRDPAQAETLSAELRGRAQALREEFTAAVREDLDHAIAAAGLVRRSDYDQLAARVAALEADLRLRRSATLPFESTSEF
jgi:polyhydroxyalkanoate synthesis regulator phasin